MTAFLDTAVFMFAAGREHPLREPCRAVLRAARAGEPVAVTSAEVVQEVLHRFAGCDRHADGLRLAQGILDLFAPVIALDHEVARQTVELAGRHPSARARDLVHVATCLVHDLAPLISPDTDFDRIGEVRRRDPAEFAG